MSFDTSALHYPKSFLPNANQLIIQ